MTQCEYDGVFYKVLCVTLIGVAITFTAILTNVFVDIDGLLINGQGINKVYTNPTISLNDHEDKAFIPDTRRNDDKQERISESSYRSKRSLGQTERFLFHVKNPQLKSMLTNRLATLLDELDADNSKASRSQNESEISIEKYKEEKVITKEEKQKIDDDNKQDVLHSDIHTFLLRDLIAQMDFDEAYDRILTLFSKNNKQKDHDLHIKSAKVKTSTESGEDNKNFMSKLSSEEKKILHEIRNCQELRNEVVDATKKIADKKKRRKINEKGPKVIIKTVMDIISLPRNMQSQKPEINSREEVKGQVKLVYNGKSIKLSQLDEHDNTITTESNEITNKRETEKRGHYNEIKNIDNNVQYKLIHNFIQKYMKHNAKYDEVSEEKEEIKRTKRHIKIRYDNKDVKADDQLQKSKSATKQDDDELFVEIETHFDSKGTKGEKKKKLIRNLIEKIQKAIHSKPDEVKKKLTHLHIKKRMQDPLNHRGKGRLINKMTLPYSAMIHRHLDPISKLLPGQESLTYSSMTGKSLEMLKQARDSRYLTMSKAINSAEMSEVDVDYNKVTYVNGVPQRIQKPLNTDDGEEPQNENAYNDMGKLKFFVKDIDGSGFSIGFNQYVDEPPDKEAMKLFTGLENIIQTYHQTYDQTESPDEAEKVKLSKNRYEEADNSPKEHVVVRRSADTRFGDDYHSNEYKIIYNSNFLPYQNYEDVVNSKIHYPDITSFHKSNNDKITKRLIVDKDILNKNLKPSEIFGLANLFNRKRRAVNVNRISSLKNKIKLNRYLNTRPMANKRLFLKNIRNKRQVNKIRIIATDNTMPNSRRRSDEDIFVVSDENVLADRAVVREVEIPEIGHENISEDHYDIISPYSYREPQDQSYATNTFSGQFRHNALMSKYPHIFLDEISRSKEQEISPTNPLVFDKYVNINPTIAHTESTTHLTTSTTNAPLPKVEEIVNAIAPQNFKTNYKVTVKIMPKNTTDTNSGFKEIHTSINKSYNKNGLLYSSLVNVSEISKIVKINKTESTVGPDISNESPIMSRMMRQREKINSLLEQHKNRIDEQLRHLSKEKEQLDTMSLTTESGLENVSQNQYFDVVLPLDPPKLLRLTKEEVNNLAVASLLRSYENTVIDIPTTTSTTTKSPITTKTTEKFTTTTQKTITEPTRKLEKQFMEQKTKMIKNIEKNGNLTNEILKKIDRNTEILQAFLRKLTDNINLIVPKHEREVIPKINHVINHLEQSVDRLPETLTQVMPKMKAINDSHVTIPFIYAYQQPYRVDNKPETPVANVIYHGHIHANTIDQRNVDAWRAKEDKRTTKEDNLKIGRRDINQTKFFIDELDSDFKVVSINRIDKKNDYVKLSNNTNVG